MDLFARALDVQDKRVAFLGGVEGGMVSFARAAAVEAEEANIQAAGVILRCVSPCWSLECLWLACNRVEALRAVFAID